MTLAIQKAQKTDKKDLLRFYKQQQYSARFLGYDQAFFIKTNNNSHIIAAVIISTINEHSPQTLLHALVVDKKHRHQQLASALLQHCISQRLTLVCFADKALTRLYINNGFSAVAPTTLTVELQQRFVSYHTKNTHLMPFYYQHSPSD